MSKIVIKNGFVYDPLNGVIGDKKDIFIEDGRIVKPFSEIGAKPIDASGKVVMPGGIDIHTHIAGAEVNTGRLMRPEEGKTYFSKEEYPRSGSGYSVPSTFTTGYLYAKMGWTTAITPSMSPLKARHTHEEFGEIPILDQAAYPLVGNNWIVMDYIKSGDIKGLAAFLAWLLKATKGYALKLVNPGGSESWAWGRNVESIDDTTTYFDVSPGEIIRGLEEANELLGLPHSIHVHANNLGSPGNYETTLKTLDRTKGVKSGNPKRKSVFHLTHAQFNSYGGTSWRDFESRAKDIAKEINSRDDVVADMGQISFDNTTTMTADGPFEYNLHTLNKLKWINGDVELECGTGVVPYVYSSKSPVNVVQWATGLELALSIKDPRKILLNSDHPNGGPFWRVYPELIGLLLSKKAREKKIRNMNRYVEKGSLIHTLDRELTLDDITWMTRAGCALDLGLKDKGHLGLGAVADVAIYDINPMEDDLSKEYKKVVRAFSTADYCIKDGKIVVKKGKITNSPHGRTYWVDVKIPEKIEKEIIKELKEKFWRYYTVNINNYPISVNYLPRPEPISIDATDKF